MEELFSLSKTLSLTHHALPSLPHTSRNTSGYGFPSTPTSCLYVCCAIHQTVMTSILSSKLSLPHTVCGDFNCHHASWLGVGTSLTCNGTSAKDFCDSLGLTQSVNFPTPISTNWYSISFGSDFDQFPCKDLLFFLHSNRFI